MLAKSKFNNIESLLSKALTDMEISHEEFTTILKEKDKYKKMKENVKNVNKKLEEEKEKTKNMQLNSVNSRTTSLQTCNLLKSIKNLHHYDDYYDFYDDFYDYCDDFISSKNFIFSVCMYKMFNTDKETYENNNIEAIIDGIGTLWLNEKHIKQKLGHKNLPAIINKYDQVYKNHKHELVNEAKKQPNRRYLRSDLALKIIMNCRTDESCNL